MMLKKLMKYGNKITSDIYMEVRNNVESKNLDKIKMEIKKQNKN